MLGVAVPNSYKKRKDRPTPKCLESALAETYPLGYTDVT